jgi:hypothetical protein
MIRISAAWAGLLLSLVALGWASAPDDRAKLLAVRESVWRAWFANDATALAKLVPLDTIVIGGGEAKWKKQADVFRTAAEFQAGGGKLVRLDSPARRFGALAKSRLFEASTWSKRKRTASGRVSSGRASEIFVLRQGRWTNPGWHTHDGKYCVQFDCRNRRNQEEFTVRS